MAQTDITIISYGVEIPLRVTYSASSGRPATRWEPEEFPELECTKVVATTNGQKVDVTDDLKEEEWVAIEAAVEDALSSYDPGYGGY